MFFACAAHFVIQPLRQLLAASRRWLLLAAVLLTVVCFGLLKPSTAVVQNQPPLGIVSAASNEADALAPESLASAYGLRLATQSDIAATPQTQLAGTTVDVGGRAASLLFVSPEQVNFLVPAGVPSGPATVTVRAGDGTISTGTTNINAVAPALFTAGGVVSGFALRVKTDSALSYEPIAEFDAVNGQYKTKAIDLGVSAGDQVFLVFYLSGLRGADPAQVRVVLGGDEFAPIYAGAVPGAPGLDQINLLLPGSLAGKGVLNLVVKAPNARPSNSARVEIGGGVSTLAVNPLGKQTVAAGETLEIEGTNLPTANVEVLFEPNVGVVPDSATPDKLTLRVPFGVATGTAKISVNKQIVYISPDPLNIVTSVSGFVQESIDGNRAPVAGLPVVLIEQGGRRLEAITNSAGAFLIKDAAVSSRSTVQIGGRAANALEYATPPFGIRVLGKRDNQVSREDMPLLVELKPNGSVTTSLTVAGRPINETLRVTTPAGLAKPAGVITAGQVSFDTNNSTVTCPAAAAGCQLALAVFDPGRTPANLPAGVFSSTIAQITPFGATLAPGGKLTFPNSDAIPPTTPVRVFRFDQTPNSATFGQFVDIGAGTVSGDGQRLETAANAVSQTSYYFISRQWQTATVIGHVVEADGQRPVRRAVVNARGQSTFTDGNGGFVLRNVPVIKPNGPNGVNDAVTLEISFHRADGSVSRTTSESLPLSAGLQVTAPEIRLPARMGASGPLILAPAALAVVAGETRTFDFIAANLGGALPGVTGAQFASVSGLGNEVYRLRLAPAASDVRAYQLTLTAGSAQQAIALTVTAASSLPVAKARTVIMDEDGTTNFLLEAGNAGSSPVYTLYERPLHGSLSGVPPNLIYTPFADYNGLDAVSFTVRSDGLESNLAVVTILVRPINDSPRIVGPGPQLVVAGQQVRLTITASDPDGGQQLICATPEAPAGSSLTQSSATSWDFNWMPAVRQVGDTGVRFEVNDGSGGKASHSVPLQATAKWAQTSGIEGGTVSAFLARSAPGFDNAIFAGTVNGGLYRSTDQGGNWTLVNAGLANPNIRALAESGGFLFAGTDSGIYRSSDNGQNWFPSSNGLPLAPESRYLGVNALLVSDQYIFASVVGGGAYRADRTGQLWTRIGNGLQGAPVLTCLVRTGGVLYAGSEELTGPGSGLGIFRSENDGDRWLRISAGIEGKGVYALAADAAGADLYAGTSEGVYVMRNGAGSWTPVNSGLPFRANGKVILVTSLFADSGSLLAATQGQAVLGSKGVYRFNAGAQQWTPSGNGITSPGALVLGRGPGGMYVGTIGGGVFRSTDQGQNWMASNRGIGSATVLSLAVNGQSYFAASYGTGIFRSNDRGQTWTAVNNGLTDLSTRGLVNKGGKLFVGSDRAGVFRSTDNGQNWTPVNNGLPTGSGQPPLIVTLLADGAALYAGGAGGVYVTRDDGAIWTPINNGLTDVTVHTLAVRGATIFAGTGGKDSSDAGGRGVYRSSDGGSNWTRLNNGLPFKREPDYVTIRRLLYVGDTLFAGTDANRNLAVITGVLFYLDSAGGQWVDVSDRIADYVPPEVSALARNEAGTKLFAGTNFGGTYLSTDQGNTLRAINGGLPPDTSALSLAFDGDTLLAGTFGGVAILTDSASVWTEAGINLTNRFINALLPNGNQLFAGTLGGGVFRSSNQGASWELSGTGLPDGANIQALAANSSSLFAATYGDGVFRAGAQGSRWEAAGGNSLGNKFVNALLASGTTIYAGTDKGVFRSIDGGANWAQAGTLLAERKVFTLAFAGTRLYAGTETGAFFSTDGGASWQDFNAGRLSNRPAVRALAVSGNSVFAGVLGGGVFRADNGGAWTEANGSAGAGLPAGLDVYSFAAGGARIYAGTIYGVFYTADRGASWRQLNAGLADIFAAALAQSGDTLFAGTRQLGVFKLQVPDDPSCRLEITSQPASRSISSGQTATLTVAVTSGAQPLQFQWYRGSSGDTNNPVLTATGDNFTTPPLSQTANYWVRIKNACNSADSATAAVVVNTPPQADLALTQSAPAQARAGDDVSFTLTVTNRGNDRAFAVTLADTLPAEVTFKSCAAPGGVCGGVGNSRVVTLAELAKDASVTITLVAGVNDNAAGVTLRNRASVSAATPDAQTANNIVSASVAVAEPAQVAPVITTLSPNTGAAGGAGFTLQVNGANFANGATVRWNGQNRQTQFNSQSQLTAQITAADLANPGVANVTVANPAPGGVSNVAPFTMAPANCSYTVQASNQFFGAGGGTGTINVTAASGCDWAVTTYDDWLSVSTTQGNGSGVVNFTVGGSFDTSRRVTTLLVAGKHVLINQAGSANCVVTPLGFGQTVSGALSGNDCRSVFSPIHFADQYSFSGQAGQRIAISLTSFSFDPIVLLIGPDRLITTADQPDFSLNARIPPANDYFVLPFTGTYVIEVVAVFANQVGNYSLNLTTAPSGSNCSYAVTPNIQSFPSGGGTGVVNVTATSGCGWTAEPFVDWIFVNTSGGTSSGEVRYTVGFNSGSVNRVGVLLIAGQFVLITQAGNAGACAVTPLSFGVPLNGALSTSNCRSVDDENSSSYAQLHSFSGQAGQRVAISMTSSSFATKLLLIGPDSAFIIESSNDPGTNSRIPRGTGYFVLPYTGTYIVEARARSSGVTGAYTLNLNAAPAPTACSFALSPTSRAFTAAGGSAAVNVTAEAGCAWAAESTVSWISINGSVGGTGAGSINYTVAPNDGPARSGALLVAGQTFTVTQDGNCTYTLSQSQQSFPSIGGNGSFNVSTSAACPWTATSNALWLTVTDGASRIGSGTVSFNLAPNTSAAPRSGALTVAGQTFSVTQAAMISTPILNTLTPNSATAGGPEFTLTVSGVGFAGNSVVRWNGGDRATSFVSETQLTARVPANDIAAPGTAQVTVFTPGASVSNGLSFVINQSSRANSLIRVVAAAGSAGGVVSVPIELVSQGDENAFGFSLTFDPAILSNPQASLGIDAVGATLNQSGGQAAQGRFGMLLALPTGQRFAAGVRRVASVTFTIAAGTSAATANIGFGDQPVVREVSDINGEVLSASYLGGAVTITRGFEADVAPRPNGNGSLTVTDWVLVGRFASGDLTVEPGSEFQRTDCAPRSSFGNGSITVSDWVQAGRYAAGLDPLTPAAGPTTANVSAADEVAALLKKADGAWPRLLRVSAPVFGARQSSAVTIELLAQGEENAASFSLRFDARQWRFVSATVGEDAREASLSINTRLAADGHVGFALALPPGEALPAGMQSLVTVNFVAAEGGGTFAPEVAFSDWPAARELAGAKAQVLAADWMPAALSLFTVPSSITGGPDLASGVVIHIGADGQQRFEPLAAYDAAENRFVAWPVDLSDETERVFLALFGTGWRNGGNLEAMEATIDGVPVEILYAGAQGGQAGLDQLNLRLPHALRGHGEVTLEFRSGARAANPVKLVIK